MCIHIYIYIYIHTHMYVDLAGVRGRLKRGGEVRGEEPPHLPVPGDATAAAAVLLLV